MDSRKVWFLVETQEEYDELSTDYPGNILLCCDQNFILDTYKEKHISQTKQLHDVWSYNRAVPTSIMCVRKMKASNFQSDVLL